MNNENQTRHDRPATLPSRSHKAPVSPGTSGETIEIDNCNICGEPVEPGQQKCYVRENGKQGGDYVAAHTACVDRQTAEKRKNLAAKPQQFMG